MITASYEVRPEEITAALVPRRRSKQEDVRVYVNTQIPFAQPDATPRTALTLTKVTTAYRAREGNGTTTTGHGRGYGFTAASTGNGVLQRKLFAIVINCKKKQAKENYDENPG